jgi:hypothetical protein
MTQIGTCRCRDTGEFWDDEARSYVRDHLTFVEVRADGWESVYVCAETGMQWVSDYPRSEEHGGGPLRLRQTHDIREH